MRPGREAYRPRPQSVLPTTLRADGRSPSGRTQGEPELRESNRWRCSLGDHAEQPTRERSYVFAHLSGGKNVVTPKWKRIGSRGEHATGDRSPVSAVCRAPTARRLSFIRMNGNAVNELDGLFCSSQRMPIYKVSMEEGRCGAVFSGNEASIPMLQIKFPPFSAKSVHLSVNLPSSTGGNLNSNALAIAAVASSSCPREARIMPSQK